MFDQLFKAQRACERHLNAPPVDEGIRYLSLIGLCKEALGVSLELERRIC